MTDYVILKRHIALKKFIIRALLCFSLLGSMAYAKDEIRVVYADDESPNRILITGAVRIYNNGTQPRKIKLVGCHENGQEVDLKKLLGVHLLLLDINMPGGGDGYSTLVRLQAEAVREGIILPPCIAVTSEDNYLNTDGKTPNLATERGFLFARNKILPGEPGFPSVFAKCAELLGNDWHITHFGRQDSSTPFSVSDKPCRPGKPRSFLVPSSVPSLMRPSLSPPDATVPSSIRSPAPKVPLTRVPSISDELEEFTSEGESESEGAVVGAAKTPTNHTDVSSSSSTSDLEALPDS